MRQSEGVRQMRAVDYFIKFGLVIAILAGICICFTKIPSFEFYLSLTSLIIGLTVTIAGFLIHRFSRKEP